MAVGRESPRANVSTRNPAGTRMPVGALAAGTATAAAATAASAIRPLVDHLDVARPEEGDPVVERGLVEPRGTGEDAVGVERIEGRRVVVVGADEILRNVHLAGSDWFSWPKRSRSVNGPGSGRRSFPVAGKQLYEIPSGSATNAILSPGSRVSRASRPSGPRLHARAWAASGSSTIQALRLIPPRHCGADQVGCLLVLVVLSCALVVLRCALDGGYPALAPFHPDLIVGLQLEGRLVQTSEPNLDERGARVGCVKEPRPTAGAEAATVIA